MTRKSTATSMPRPKNNETAPPPIEGSRYCASCGRIMKADHDDATPRKFCSRSCHDHAKRGPAFKAYRLQLAQAYYELLNESTIGHVVMCSEVEAAVPCPEKSEPHVHREESRRAARRLVAFGFVSQGIDCDKEVEAVQDGQVVETSFAKGDWAIRLKS